MAACRNDGVAAVRLGTLVLLLHSLAHLTSAAEFPREHWLKATAAEVGLDEGELKQARDYALTGGGSGYITRYGKLVMTWGNPEQRYDLKSTTKSFGTAALGLAIKDGKMRLSDKARQHHPTLGVPPESNTQTGWLDAIAILHLASQTAGFEKPGGFTPLLFKPGTQWDYSDSGPNWLAECITLAYRRDVDELMFERVFTPLGIRRSDLVWRKNSYRPDLLDGIKRREFGAGISANVDAMARFGLLWLRGGEWNTQQILPRDFVNQARTTVPGVPELPVRNPADYGQAARHYGLLWWNNADETIEGVPLDTYWSWGLYDSLIVVMPTLDIVVARAGQSWKRTQGADHYEVLKPFLLPIAAAAGTKPASKNNSDPSAAPYPPSPVIQGIEWAPPDTIIRQARGSDNWPLTWADDDALYTAYGDGHGFEPYVKSKLSLGLAKVLGTPPDIHGVNIRSAISYNASLKRYLWCQIGPGNDTRFTGGFAIYDAPEPWGPWTTAFHTDAWDVGPGESSSLPTKWMSADGRTVHLVFSGEDHFSVRRGIVMLRDPQKPTSP